MKKFILFAVIFILSGSLCLGAEYPMDKGATMIEGSFSFSSSTGKLFEDYEGNALTLIAIGSSMMEFAVPNFALGANLTLLYGKQGDASFTSLGIGPKFLYAVGDRYAKTYPYVGVGFNYVRNTETYVTYGYYSKRTEEYTISGTSFTFEAGAIVMLESHVGLVLKGSFSLTTLKPEDGRSASGNIFMLGVGLTNFMF